MRPNADRAVRRHPGWWFCAPPERVIEVVKNPFGGVIVVLPERQQSDARLCCGRHVLRLLREPDLPRRLP